VIFEICEYCNGYGKLQRVAPKGLEHYTPYGFDKPFDCPYCNGSGKKVIKK